MGDETAYRIVFGKLKIRDQLGGGGVDGRIIPLSSAIQLALHSNNI
jgi:hypothetical protein